VLETPSVAALSHCGPPTGGLRVALRPLWPRAVESFLGIVEGESGLPSAAPTAWPRTLARGAPTRSSFEAAGLGADHSN
jgi:hypothetical protein